MRQRGALRAAMTGVMGSLAACAGTSSQPPSEEAPMQETGELQVTGTVRKAQVGVNCWRFVGSDGTSYELRPDQAPAEVLGDGKTLTLILVTRGDLTSTCMVGQIVDVVRVVTP